MVLQRALLCVLLLAPFANGVVQFEQSALYDIFDFMGVPEVHLPQCANGCLIFASTMGKDNDDYAQKLMVRSNSAGVGESIAKIAKYAAATSQKLPYDAPTPGSYSIVNLNPTTAGSSNDVAVWVIDRAYASSFDYEIYDVLTMARRNAVPKSVVTVMGARQFVVEADRGAANVLTARLTGFDNARSDNSTDQCTYAYQTQQFNGFEFHVDGPIVSLAFDMKNLVAIRANYNFRNDRNLAKDGFVTSPGYNGCYNSRGLYKPFRQLNSNFGGGDAFDFTSKSKIRVVWDMNYSVSEEVVLKDITNDKRYSLKGDVYSKTITMVGTDYANVFYSDVRPPSGFILRHTKA